MKIALPVKYYRKHRAMHILYTFSFYVHPVQFCPFEIPLNASKHAIYR